MRSLAVVLVALLAVPSLAFAEVDPTAREAALKYERAVQEGNIALREANKQAEAMLTGLLVGKTPSEKDLGDVADALQKAVSDFQAKLKDAPPPEGPEARAYSLAVNAYLLVLEKYKKEDLLKALRAAKKPEEDLEKNLAALEPLMKLGRGTQAAMQGIRNTRKAFLAAYEITPADLGRTPAANPSAAPGSPADSTALPPTTTGVPMPADGADPVTGAPAGEPAVPLTGPAALDKAIRDGEKAFRESTETLQTKLLSKVITGGQIEPAEIEEGFAGVTAGIARFEEQLASVQVPDDPESKAYVAATKKLIANLKKADFGGLARILTNKSLTAEARQNQLTKKVGGLGAGMEKDFATFEKARKAFVEKHKLLPMAGADGSTPSGPGGEGMP